MQRVLLLLSSYTNERVKRHYGLGGSHRNNLALCPRGGLMSSQAMSQYALVESRRVRELPSQLLEGQEANIIDLCVKRRGLGQCLVLMFVPRL